MYIKRDRYLNQLISRQGNGQIKIIKGVRQCGKSFLLFKIFCDHLKSTGVPDDHIISIALGRQKNGEEKFKYLSNLFDEVYFKDIVERYQIELIDVLGELTDALCSSVGSLTNASKIVNTLKSVKGVKVSSETITAYLEYLTDSFLFKRSRRYDVKGKKYFEYPSKYYCVDIGLRNVRLNLRQQEETHIMENIVYNELLTRGFSVDVGVVRIEETDEAGKRRQKSYEIDFVVNKGAKKYYIQSALNISDDMKARQELRPLLTVNDFFKKFVITKTSMKPWVDEIGIIHLGLYDFLLNEDCFEL